VKRLLIILIISIFHPLKIIQFL